jgi:hypothetical protein
MTNRYSASRQAEISLGTNGRRNDCASSPKLSIAFAFAILYRRSDRVGSYQSP